MSRNSRERAFAALLKYWRNHRGMSQLDLALSAEVSTRHLSFLETGRSNPSADMVLLLAQVLNLPMRGSNELLRAAGFDSRYSEPSVAELLSGPLGFAVDTMLSHHDPFPMMVLDRLYNVIRTNQAGLRLFALAGIDLKAQQPGEINILRLVFDPEKRHMISDWDQAACLMLRRLQREVMSLPEDSQMRGLLDELLDLPDIPALWQKHDFSEPEEPMLSVEFSLAGIALRFLTTITEFNAPQNVTLEELRIESYFPHDEETNNLCKQLLA